MSLAVGVAIEREPGMTSIEPTIRLIRGVDGEDRALDEEVPLEADAGNQGSGLTIMRARSAHGLSGKLKLLRCEAVLLIPTGTKRTVTIDTLNKASQ